MNHRSSIFTLHWTSDSSSVGKDFRSNQPVIPFSVTKLPTATMATPPAPVKNNPSSPQNLQCMTDPELQKVFDQFDADGDGRISLPELSQVLSSLGSRSSSADLRLAMAEIDSDGDGFISLPEFSAFCRSGSSSASSNEAELREAFCIYDEDRYRISTTQVVRSFTSIPHFIVYSQNSPRTSL